MAGKSKTTKLQLELRKDVADKTGVFGTPGGAVALVTPPIDEDYWVLRVKVSDTQAVVGFPKFGLIGIGFAKEGDWNTNLPWSCLPEEIYNHIARNRAGADPAKCKEAIRMIQEAVVDLKLISPEMLARGLRLRAEREEEAKAVKVARTGSATQRGN